MFLVFGDCARQLVLAQTPDTQSGPASQNTTVLQPLPDHTGTGWNSAHNRWQQTAVDIQSQVDTVDPTERAQRNVTWKWTLSLLNTGTPLIMIDDTRPELDVADNSVWVIATFENYHIYAIDPAYHILYTEINLRVENVIRASPDLHLSVGDLIDVGIPGGKVKSPARNIVSFNLEPHQYDYQPGHKYLLRLLPAGKSSGNPLVPDTTIKQTYFHPYKRWDITSGTVQPDDQVEVSRAARGASVLKGMSISDLINYLQSVLPPEPKK